MALFIGFVLLLAVVVLFNIVKSRRRRQHSLRPDFDLIVPSYRPGSLCPSLVKIEIDIHGNKYMDQFYKRKPNPTSVGFIVKSEEGEEECLTTVWGQSWCLYDPDESTKVLRKVAKVTVILHDNFKERFDGIVTYVDFDFDLAIVVFKHPKHFKIPELPTFGNFIDKHILSCDFHFNYPWNDYLVEHYTLKSSNEVKGFKFKSSIEVEDLVEGDDDNDNDDDLQQFHKCGSYFHVEKKYCTAGVLLDATNLNIVGMKFGKCHSMELAHVLPIQEIVARLHHKSQTKNHTDIQPRLIIEDSHLDRPTPMWGVSPYVWSTPCSYTSIMV